MPAADECRSRLVDLSHEIHDGLVTYPGLPAPVITSHLSREDSRAVYAPGTEFAIGSITMVGNTGTYIDSPFHRFPDGADLAGLELSRLAGVPALRIDLTSSGDRAIDATAFEGRVVEGRAVLLHTGWDRHFGTPAYGVDAPYLSDAGAAYLVAAGAGLVGIDSVNIDDARPNGPRPAHTLLLAAGIPIVEHLTNLARVPLEGARFTAVPPRVSGFGTFPVRAYVEID